jgi:photosystem II stability/assembly factor-like uncharacterized protein
MKFTFMIFFLLTSFSYTQWELRNNGIDTQSGIAWAIDALDSNYAVIGYNGFYKTTDGGLNWTHPDIPVEASIVDIEMVDEQTIIYGSTNGMIYKSTDGGNTWSQKFFNSSLTTFINYVKMFDADKGIAMGDALSGGLPAVFIKTTDGGESWVSINNNAFGGYSGDTWRRIDFTDEHTGYFYESGINPQALYKTTDGGSSWNIVDSYPLVALINFYDDQIGLFAIIPEYIVYRTVDGAISWSPSSLVFPAWLGDFEFLPDDPSKIWFASKSKLYFSDDTAATFQEQFISSESIYIRDIHCVDEKTVWLLADNGLVFRNTNGNKITGISEDLKPLTDFRLYQNYSNPFNPSTIIRYNLPVRSSVLLTVYDILGNEIEILVNEERTAGTHTISWNAGDLPSGIYFYKLNTGSFTETKKMILMK